MRFGTSDLKKLAVIPLAFLLFGANSYSVSNGATQTIDEHGECRKVTNNHASGLAIFVPTKTSGEWASFRNNAPPSVIVAACSCSVTPGNQSFTTAGTHTFTVPCHNNLIVQVWGGGGGGAGAPSGNTSGGGNSNWDGAVYGNRGGNATTSPGAGGTASGGTTNTTGQAGTAGANGSGGKGGNGANGGAGGASRGNSVGNGNGGTAPGGGGGGGAQGSRAGVINYDGGGGGGYATRTYTAGTYAVNASVTVVVGAGGTKGNGSNYDGGNGAVGRVTVTWN